MNPLVLVRVAAALDRTYRGSVLAAIREDGRDRFRLKLSGPRRTGTVVISLRPELPWIGTIGAPPRDRSAATGPFLAACSRALDGTVVAAIRKDPVDRVVHFELADGHRLVAELATHGANLVLLDREGKVLAAARQPRAGRERLSPGCEYRARGLPENQIAAFGADPGTIDRLVADAVAGGDDAVDVLRRRVFGLGTEGATLVVEESRALGRSPGEVLAARLEALLAGSLDPVVIGPGDPRVAAELPGFSAANYRLLPWEPLDPAAGLRGEDAAETAGLYHAAVERAFRIAEHLEGLRRILGAESARTFDREGKARADVAKHESPDRYRIWGEALLAGLRSARREGDRAIVPDPYDIEGRLLSVPAPASLSLTAAADDLFRRHRRSLRGLAAAKERAIAMAERLVRLEGLRARFEPGAGAAASAELEALMRKEGIAVSLEAGTRAGKALQRARGAAPRVEGVRIVTSGDGFEVLVGRTARDNDRLTFRLASPEDWWFHVQGRPGAHVVVRNPERAKHLPERTLKEAASLAAWYSDARAEGAVEVHWTRRKNVRRIRGALPGTVSLKRFETIRVRPASEEQIRGTLGGA